MNIRLKQLSRDLSDKKLYYSEKALHEIEE
jgi:hypothetical protein